MGDVEIYPYDTRVPVSMIKIGKEKPPIEYLLHMRNGIIDELEIFTYDDMELSDFLLGLYEVEFYEIGSGVVWRDDEVNVKNPALNDTERLWISTLMEASFLGRDTLVQQINTSKIVRIDGSRSIRFAFTIDNSFEKYPFRVQAPISMIQLKANEGQVLFELHVSDGLVDYFEISSASNEGFNESIIDLNCIEYYKLHAEVIIGI